MRNRNDPFRCFVWWDKFRQPCLRNVSVNCVTLASTSTLGQRYGNVGLTFRAKLHGFQVHVEWIPTRGLAELVREFYLMFIFKPPSVTTLWQFALNRRLNFGDTLPLASRCSSRRAPRNENVFTLTWRSCTQICSQRSHFVGLQVQAILAQRLHF